MRYKLSDHYELCGFKNLPYGIMEKRSKSYKFLNAAKWEIFQRIAYGQEIEEDSLDEAQMEFFNGIIHDHIVEALSDGEKSNIPPYHSYKNRFKESVQWSITGKCNAKCKHCFMSAPNARMGEPTLQQCLDIIDMLDKCGTRQVSITGGEPFVRQDFWQIIDAILEHDLRITTIYSNGILINQNLIDEFIKRDIHPSWQISFDGIDGWHDWMRGVEGATKAAVNAIKLLKNNGFSVSCATSVFKGNVATIPETIEFLASLGVSSVKIGCMQQQGEWLKYQDQWLSHQEELDFYMDYLPRYVKSNSPISLQCEGIFMGRSNEEGSLSWELLLDKKCPEDLEFKIKACEVLRKNYYIGATGAVLPCMSLEGTPAGDKFPNLFHTSLQEILTDSYYTKMAEASIGDVNQHNPECTDCQHKLQCCSGCRAMAVGAGGEDYLAIDKRTCMIVKEGWTEKIRAAIEEGLQE